MLIRVLRFCCAAFLFSVAVLADAQAQYQVLYNFGASGPNDGDLPLGKLVMDDAGNLYGTTKVGGNGAGTVFELTPSIGGSWTETVLYNFCSQPGCADGQSPSAGLIFDGAGNLYGTTQQGGLVQGCCFGTAFELSPPTIPGGAWTESVLHAFGGGTQDGCYPESKLTLDASGNLYGTTSQCGGGSYNAGTVFELMPSGDGTWSEIVLYNFCVNGHKHCRDGALPEAGVAFDHAGNLYGTTNQGGVRRNGVVYELSPNPSSEWTETVLHYFGSAIRGGGPFSAINFDELGNLYGTAYDGGSTSSACDGTACGSVFRLAPSAGEWKYSAFLFAGPNGGNPAAGVFLDTKHNTIYGTTKFGGASRAGTVYSIHRKTETVLYNFCSQPGCADGNQPTTALITDKKGNLFGVASQGGAFNQGVVFEITP